MCCLRLVLLHKLSPQTLQCVGILFWDIVDHKFSRTPNASNVGVFCTDSSFTVLTSSIYLRKVFPFLFVSYTLTFINAVRTPFEIPGSQREVFNTILRPLSNIFNCFILVFVHVCKEHVSFLCNPIVCLLWI